MATQGEKIRQRTCIACGVQGDKRTLHRIVRNAKGGVSFDASGRAPGRGAYVCSAKCLADAFKKQKVQRALRCAVSPEEQQDVIDGAMRALGEVE